MVLNIVPHWDEIFSHPQDVFQDFHHAIASVAFKCVDNLMAYH